MISNCLNLGIATYNAQAATRGGWLHISLQI